jgi:polypeptide N-acetylgalactosaminyltransferase
MVIPYLHERWAHIEATVASIISYTPADLLDEILFIDDGNDADWQYHDMLQAIHPKVKVHRNPRRLGLIKSKVIGADLTNSSVIMFMEPHCIVSQHWLEPLLMQMTGPSHNMVVVPTLDIIPENNFSEYQLAGQSLGGFDWNLQFNWFTEISKRNKSWKDAEPYPSPALSGGIFAIWRDFWENSGKYDASMLEWGGENIEMSLRIWRCGGRIEIVPCSRIGHRFRKSFPYAFHLEAQNRNPARVAEVWLDDYKEDVYEHAPQLRSTDAGDFTERLKLKERLKCKSMEWYIENVYPELRQSSLVWKRKHGLVYIDASS